MPTRDVLSAANDNILDSVFDINEAFFVDIAEVACFEPAILCQDLG